MSLGVYMMGIYIFNIRRMKNNLVYMQKYGYKMNARKRIFGSYRIIEMFLQPLLPKLHF